MKSNLAEIIKISFIIENQCQKLSEQYFGITERYINVIKIISYNVSNNLIYLALKTNLVKALNKDKN